MNMKKHATELSNLLLRTIVDYFEGKDLTESERQKIHWMALADNSSFLIYKMAEAYLYGDKKTDEAIDNFVNRMKQGIEINKRKDGKMN